MTENDYIAEYIKEKHQSLLGFDFAVWKSCCIIRNAVGQISGILATIPTDQLKKVMEIAGDDYDIEDEREN